MENLRLDISLLKPNNKNPRKIEKKSLKELEKSLKKFPEMLEAREIVINKDYEILGGNMRYLAAKNIGIKELPVKIVIWSEQKEKEFIIKDNINNGDWDYDVLASNWDEKEISDWGMGKLEFLKEKDIVEDDPPSLDKENHYSEIGKYYKLGNHLLYCGSFEDATELFKQEKAIACVTDPPYGIGYNGVEGRRRKPIKNDKMSDGDFKDFLKSIADNIASNVSGGAIVFMSFLKIDDLRNALESAGLTWRGYILWVKNYFTLGGSDFRHQFEGALYHVNDGKYDAMDGESSEEAEIAIYGDINQRRVWNGERKQSDVFFFKKPNKSKEHPTMKPVGLCAKALLTISNAKDVVYDPFLGSGSTLIACEQTDRKCYGCELSEEYCDVIRKRYWTFVNGNEKGWQENTPEINLKEIQNV